MCTGTFNLSGTGLTDSLVVGGVNAARVLESDLRGISSTREEDADAKFAVDVDVKSSEPAKPEVNCFDVAAYILHELGRMSTMKLQKLVYYSQAWSLVWDEEPLFEDEIEAWANGPVVRRLFDYHRGYFTIGSVAIGAPHLLDEDQRATIDAVLEFYGDKSAQWLIDQSHSERPWREARCGMEPTERGSSVIPIDAMAEYYSSILANG